VLKFSVMLNLFPGETSSYADVSGGRLPWGGGSYNGTPGVDLPVADEMKVRSAHNRNRSQDIAGAFVERSHRRSNWPG